MDYTLLGFKVVGQMFNAHPVFVHFPIALIPASLLLYFLGVVLKNRSLLVGGRACLYMALAGAAVAVGTG
ncbi:MAG TPA: hypothetical protein PKD69_06450, partial [Elusimicrobiota bacterium]|nr:hypothetical protein [Elusimicrobiota bacterium]